MPTLTGNLWTSGNSDLQTVAEHEAVDGGRGREDEGGRGHHLNEEHFRSTALLRKRLNETSLVSAARFDYRE